MGRDHFQTTQWTLFRQLSCGSEEDTQMAISVICEHYWFPLYAFVRRNGYGREDAQDVLQNFFLSLLEGQWLQQADARKGKLRTFLITILKRQMASDWRKQYRQKRGSGEVCASFETLNAEEWYMQSPPEVSSEVLYDYQWAVALLGHSMRDLQEDYTLRGKRDRFDGLKDYLEWDDRDDGRDGYQQVAERMNMTESGVKIAVYRMRKQFRRILLGHVRETLEADDPVADADVEHELKHLFHVLGSAKMLGG